MIRICSLTVLVLQLQTSTEEYAEFSHKPGVRRVSLVHLPCALLRHARLAQLACARVLVMRALRFSCRASFLLTRCFYCFSSHTQVIRYISPTHRPSGHTVRD